MKIGDKVWVYDENRRIYKKDSKGRSSGPPIWREHWREEFIVGENRANWIIGSSYHLGRKLDEHDKKRLTKLPKNSPKPLWIVLSEEELNQKVWIHDNHYRLGEAVSRCGDYETMRKIAELLGGVVEDSNDYDGLKKAAEIVGYKETKE